MSDAATLGPVRRATESVMLRSVHHLHVLRDAGLITASRRGRWVDYRLETDALTNTFAVVMPDLAGAFR